MHNRAFTLIELIVVLVVLAVLAAFALPRFADLQRQSRIETLNGVAGAMRSTIAVVQSKARVQGLSPSASNPVSGGNQTGYLVETEAGVSEVDWRNLCPESQAELADTLAMPDHIGLALSGGLQQQVTNQSTWVGYDLTTCVVIYDSFACTVTVVDAGC
ncbi:prepilin-type cleavage/methylation domain-containing protein [Bacterioplanes sanyensis]|uniref:Prepilin-type cleavage/methylation domain-containing protein n=1 Tax=Bacterioplanes sanyensis TaxID=1249553 RepID=A0A222FK16_9GAMM|nr:prepilin-type N-terminal cleavage/methylation domain-containing protein [Bacterioplanes sanyensis]ASP39348.1 prepilin-type cleavage/methylation domain-containing protein [Bacterioplanes sanyensis]